MTAIPFHVGDCVLLYNAASDSFDKLTLQRKLPDPYHRITFWDAVSRTGETFTVGEHEIEHTPRDNAWDWIVSLVLILGTLGIILLASFSCGVWS